MTKLTDNKSVESAAQTATEVKPVQRRPARRSSVSGPRNVLKISNTEPGYTYRVVNDVGDRVETLKEIGYEVVTDSNVRVGDRRAGKAGSMGTAVEVSVGQGVKGIVMRQREDYYKEDQASKLERVKEDEESMYRRARQEESDYGDLKVSRKANT